MFRLSITRDDTKVDELLLEHGTVTIGRKSDNDVCIPEPTVSSYHAQIIAARELTRVVDLGSTNGTYVNGRRVGEHILADGDVIVVGKHKLIYERHDAAAAYPLPDRTIELSREELDELLAALDGNSQRQGGTPRRQPSRINWVAQDAEGIWWGYSRKPLRGETGWHKTATDCIRLKQGARNPDWHHTLRKV